MRKINVLNMVFKSMLVFTLTLIFLHKASAQENDLNEEIEKHRKGELIIHAKTGNKVMVEHLEHEFWFGAAISDGMVSGSMSVEDIIQYIRKNSLKFQFCRHRECPEVAQTAKRRNKFSRE